MEFNGIVGRHFRRQKIRSRMLFAVLLLAATLVVAEATLATPPSALLAQLSGTETHAVVEDNPVNSLYAQLEGRAEALTEREAEIINREIEAGIAERERNNAVLLYAMFGLFALILINSVFDFIEVRELHALERALRAKGAGRN